MKGNAECERWYREDYLVRYPSPPHNKRPLEADAKENGFRLAKLRELQQRGAVLAQGAGRIIMTQSNTISSIQGGRERPEDILGRSRTVWQHYSTLFRGTKEAFEFGGSITYLQKER